VDGRYFAIAKEKAPCMVKDWAEQKSLSGKVQFDSSAMSYDGYLHLKKELVSAELSPVSNPLKKVRAVKDEVELNALTKAAKLTLAGIEHVISSLKVGVNEEQMAWEFEQFCRKKGASGLSF